MQRGKKFALLPTTMSPDQSSEAENCIWAAVQEWNCFIKHVCVCVGGNQSKKRNVCKTTGFAAEIQLLQRGHSCLDTCSPVNKGIIPNFQWISVLLIYTVEVLIYLLPRGGFLNDHSGLLNYGMDPLAIDPNDGGDFDSACVTICVLLCNLV